MIKYILFLLCFYIKKIKCTHILCANELTKTHLYNNALVILDNSP